MLERARLRRRLAGHQLQGLPRYERGVGGLLANAGTATTYVDGSVTNGTTYYYKVSAENANGEGTLSAGSTATPTDLVVPEALVTVDDFNRANETLSDSVTNGTKWVGRDGIERQFQSARLLQGVDLHRLAQRQPVRPDVEVWTTISTLPGSRNAVRLLARLQGVGTSTYDGYMLRTNQLAGTDQVFLERVDNGAVVSRLTMNQEFAVGDTSFLWSRARRSRPGATTARPGPDSASCRTRFTARTAMPVSA